MATATPEAPAEFGVIPSFDVTIRVRRFNPCLLYTSDAADD